MAKAIIIDPRDVLTDETDNHQNAMALIRQIVASAGVRVPEKALEDAENFAIESFAPNEYDAIVFKMVDRDTTLALRCASAFRKNHKRVIKLRQRAAQIVAACRERGWRIALATSPAEDEVAEYRRAGIWDMLDVKGPPPAVKIYLPDVRVLEFLVGQLGVTPGDCAVLGNRMDNHVRPANNLRMTSIQLQTGTHGSKQLPRDLRDVPDYEAPDVDALLTTIPAVV